MSINTVRTIRTREPSGTPEGPDRPSEPLRTLITLGTLRTSLKCLLTPGSSVPLLVRLRLLPRRVQGSLLLTRCGVVLTAAPLRA